MLWRSAPDAKSTVRPRPAGAPHAHVRSSSNANLGTGFILLAPARKETPAGSVPRVLFPARTSRRRQTAARSTVTVGSTPQPLNTTWIVTVPSGPALTTANSPEVNAGRVVHVASWCNGVGVDTVNECDTP